MSREAFEKMVAGATKLAQRNGRNLSESQIRKQCEAIANRAERRAPAPKPSSSPRQRGGGDKHFLYNEDGLVEVSKGEFDSTEGANLGEVVSRDKKIQVDLGKK